MHASVFTDHLGRAFLKEPSEQYLKHVNGDIVAETDAEGDFVGIDADGDFVVWQPPARHTWN